MPQKKSSLSVSDVREEILVSINWLLGQVKESEHFKEFDELHERMLVADFNNLQELVAIGGDLNNVYANLLEEDDPILDFKASTYFEYACSILTLHIIQSAGGGPDEFIKLMNDVAERKTKKLLS